MNRKGIILTFCLLFMFSTFQAFGASRKDVLLVLDTSLSMAGHGGKNILEQVKGSISRYIDQLEDGDRVTFVTFDEGVKFYPTVLVDDENDKDILKKYISITPAKGKWTNTFGMIEKVFDKADELERGEEGRQIQIVVMTDGIDDPSPARRGQRISMKDIANKHQGKDNWWIYFVDLSVLKKNQKLSAEKERLRKQLQKVSKKSAIIDAGTDPELGIQEVKEHEKKNKGYFVPLILAILIVLILIIILLFLKKQASLKVSGRLEYWNNEVLNPFIENFDLTRHMAKEVMIGNKLVCHLNITDLESHSPFLIKAVWGPDKELALELDPGEGNVVEFKNRDADGYIQEGDVFIVNNFTFKYFSS